MPEPNTVTAPREPEPRDESTAGWVQPPVASEPPPEAAVTVTRTIASTPGPGDHDRHTIASQTQAITRGDLGHPTRLPDIPGYRVEQMIGRGGMGVVYRAIDLTLNRVVALKVMHPGGRDYQHVMGRFDREVRALAQIDHPNIVRIFDADDWHGFPYFTMQFVPGGPLSHHLGRFHGDAAACVRLVAKVARAVQALHDHKVIHRDLKPLNILLGDSDEPLVADFGLAKWLDDDPQSDYSATGHPVGTRQYMAPEQTLGKRSDYSAACDVWAIGVVLYELLAGRRPFVDDGRGDLLKRIREEAPPAMPETVPAELAAVVAKCLAKSASERYPTAAAVADDLERWLAGEPVSVAAPRRKRGWRTGVALLALGLVIALPAGVIPWNPPAGPQKQTVADRVRDGETVFLTDAKGKPLRPLTPIARQLLTTGVNDEGYFYFQSHGPGMARLLDEPLPLPVRIECEISIPTASDGKIHDGGIFFGEKAWATGAVVHYSALRAFIVQEPTKQGVQPLRSSVSFHHRQDDRNFGAGRFEPDKQAGLPGKDDKARVVPFAVVLRLGEVRVTIDGQDFKPLGWDALQQRLRHDVLDDARLRNYPFEQPVLGDGIGITLNNTDLIVRNFRITKLDP